MRKLLKIGFKVKGTAKQINVYMSRSDSMYLTYSITRLLNKNSFYLINLICACREKENKIGPTGLEPMTLCL